MLETPSPSADRKSDTRLKVYITYSQDNEAVVSRVLKLSDRLRADGIDCTAAEFVYTVSSSDKDWSSRARKEILQADFVLVVCTRANYWASQNPEKKVGRKGTEIDVQIIRELLYEGRQLRCVPVTFYAEGRQFIPDFLQGFTYFDLSSPDGYENLLRLLHGAQTISVSPPEGVTERLGATESQSAAVASRSRPEEEGGSAADDETEAAEQTFEQLRQSGFTKYAWDTIGVARKLANSERPCSVRTLLAAIMLSGSEDRAGEYTGGWLLRQVNASDVWIMSRIAEVYPFVSNESLSFRDLLGLKAYVAQTMTGRLNRTIALAHRLAVEGSRGRKRAVVSVRHLLAAALAHTNENTNVDRFLRRFQTNIAEVRKRILVDLPSWGVQDDPEVWRQLLESPVITLNQHGLPTYAADLAAGPDAIGIMREVEAMASLASAWSVEPPLSIGLFGEWGSGKSFFMQKMKERVRQIASAARKSQKGQKEFGYYKNIVQVEFNAWHYVEGNLWASLVEHIFSNLRLEGIGEEDVDSEANIRQRLEKLLDQVREKSAEAAEREQKAQQSSQEAEEKKKAAENRAIRLEEEARAARERAKTAEEEGRQAAEAAAEKQRQVEVISSQRDSLGFKDILSEITGSEEIRKEVNKDLAVLGITEERTRTVAGLRDSLREASEAGLLLREGANILLTDRRRWWLIAWVAAVPTTLGLLLWVGATVLKQDKPWVQTMIGVSSAVTTIITAIVAFWKRYSPKLKPLLGAVTRIKEKRALLERQVDDARQERIARATELDRTVQEKRVEAAEQTKIAQEKGMSAVQARREAEQTQEQAERASIEAALARADAEKLRREADALLPERRIATFIQDRANARDYRRHLGVPALIRRDFEKLAAMFNTQRSEESLGKDGLQAGSGRNDLAIVNRIILYIDDLDRCPPEKVVEVLRAIHLLLAFPLFVVIVAVDARWVKRSLRDRFSLMLAQSQEEMTRIPKDEQLALGQMATPDDYLEKIFQVPFWIRPLTETASRNLVNALTQDDVAIDSDRKPVDGEPKEDQQQASGKESTPVAIKSAPVTLAQTPDPGQARSQEFPALGVANPNGPTEWSTVQPSPRMLQLAAEEREYMAELAAVIGRSPRCVKRFVNCYRLLKAAVDRDDLARVNRMGTFRTAMLLLAMVSAVPDLAPFLLNDLRKTGPTTKPSRWAKDVAQKFKEAPDRERWKQFLLPIERLETRSKVSTIRPLIDAADFVDRFSFNPVRPTSDVAV